ncbi:hypothetical protein C3L33_15370, partial [Rhododendron williamsianum]
MKNWIAKVKVLEKWSPRSTQHSPVKYQKLILADAEGNRVQAMIYNDNIKKLEDTLQVYNTYLISNATVKFTMQTVKFTAIKYRTVDADFDWQWTIDASMKYATENDQNVVAIFPKLAIENEYQIQLKRREYPSHGVKVLAYNINSIKPALNEDNSKKDQPTNTEKAS